MLCRIGVMIPVPVLVSWSSGKDSAWTLHTLRQQPELYDVRGIFTTVTPRFQRVSIQATPIWVLKLQSERLGLPLYQIPIPSPCSNADYEAAMQQFFANAESLPDHLTATHFAFGDLYLEDIRRYREEKLEGTEYTPLFPLWGEDTTELARKMIRSGLRAIVTAINPDRLPKEFAGRWFDMQFIADLPEDVDPLGENGEFHTCVIDGPMLTSSIDAKPGEVVERPVAISRDEDDGIHTSNHLQRTVVYADVVARK